jgi:hypothetical protein
MTIAYNLGVGTTIVQLLRYYGAVPVEFLIDKLNADPDDIEEYLSVLERGGAIRRYDEKVELVPEHTELS